MFCVPNRLGKPRGQTPSPEPETYRGGKVELRQFHDDRATRDELHGTQTCQAGYRSPAYGAQIRFPPRTYLPERADRFHQRPLSPCKYRLFGFHLPPCPVTLTHWRKLFVAG